MIKLLFIEDHESSIVDALQLIQEEIEVPSVEVSQFEPALELILSFLPDIVILDLEGVPSTPRYDGFDIRDFIWDNRFCPIVVYSAYVEDYEAEYDEHPLVKTVPKGEEDSPERVLNAVRELVPVTEALRTTQEQVDQRFWEAMKVIAPIALKTTPPSDDLINKIIRSGRRRVAAMMDVPVGEEPPLSSWEQYLYPPVSPDPEVGDVLRTEKGSVDDPYSFRVVLTPSCDMVSSGNRTPKVNEVLVAKCFPVDQALQMINMTGNGNKRHRQRLQSAVLSQGFYQSLIIVPALTGAIPPMAANLKDLQLIPMGDIGSGKAYERVASVDSPFKETVAWAYLQIACRPGLPERDLDAWALEVVESVSIKEPSKEE